MANNQDSSATQSLRQPFEGTEGEPAARPEIPLYSTPLGETIEEKLVRLRTTHDRLQQELEAQHLEEEIERMERVRATGAAPVEPAQLRAETPSTSSGRNDGATLSRNSGGRLKLKEPTPFEGKSIREARSFLRELELNFALSGDLYSIDKDKVLYGVMFLAGDPQEKWHLDHSVDALGEYTFDDFKEFVRDVVGDPVNRSITVTLSYEKARQREGQTVQQFASELDVMEDQMSRYSEEQRMRYLLAKLSLAIR